MDFLSGGFLQVVTWICQSCFMDLFKFIHGHVKVVLCISRPLPKKTKLKFEYFWASTFLPTSEVHYKKSNLPLANALDAPSDKQIAIASLPHIGWAVHLGLEWMFSSRYWWFQWIMLIMKLTWWSRLASNWRRFKLEIFNGVKLTAASHRVKSATYSGKSTFRCVKEEEPQIHLSTWNKRATNSSLNVKSKRTKFTYHHSPMVPSYLLHVREPMVRRCKKHKLAGVKILRYETFSKWW